MDCVRSSQISLHDILLETEAIEDELLKKQEYYVEAIIRSKTEEMELVLEYTKLDGKRAARKAQEMLRAVVTTEKELKIETLDMEKSLVQK